MKYKTIQKPQVLFEQAECTWVLIKKLEHNTGETITQVA